MGAAQSVDSIPAPSSPSNAAPEATDAVVDEEKFKEDVRKAAAQFKNLVNGNKVMIFSATYCSYCTVYLVLCIL